MLVLRETVHSRLNLELACVPEIIGLAVATKPDQATLVPERREEVTTEGGLDVVGCMDSVRRSVDALREAGIRVSLFLDPDQRQLAAAADLPIDAVELHTGQYALANDGARDDALQQLADAADTSRKRGWALHAGHGLNYWNVGPVAALENMFELNIGHAIIARAVLVGMQQAVREMKQLVA